MKFSSAVNEISIITGEDIFQRGVASLACDIMLNKYCANSIMAPLQVSSSNWMGGIPDRTRLYDLYMPGTHDSATGYFYRRRDNVNYAAASLVMTHDKRSSIKDQLENGIRYLDLRFSRERESDGFPDNPLKFWQLYHGVYFLATNLDEALTDVKTFLTNHPTETVFVRLQPANDAWGELNPVEFENEIINHPNFKSNPSLSSLIPKDVSLNSQPNKLWVASHKDLDDIRKLRPSKGLGGLGKSYDLVETGYSKDKAILSPRVETNPRLNYGGLALGDVRGKIVVIESFFRAYPGNGWNEPTTPVDPIENQTSIIKIGSTEVKRAGIYTTGVNEQDNYDGPSYKDKRNDIKDFAKRTSDQNLIPTDGPTDLRVNYSSASGSLVSSYPLAYALELNSGRSDLGYKTNDNDDTLASLLNINSLDVNAVTGELTKENLRQKLWNARGLNGVLAGDFYTTSQSWYNEYWNHWYYTKEGAKPNPNSDDYSSSDWFTQKIWRQSAILTPSILAKPQSNDLLTGLPVVKEGGSFELSWNNFMGVAKTGFINSNAQIGDGTSNWPLKYSVLQIDPVKELGVTESNSYTLGMASATSFIKSNSRAKRQFTGVGSEVQKGFDFDQKHNAFIETFSVAFEPGAQGDRFFRVQLKAELDTPFGKHFYGVGTPVYFMVTD